MKKTLMISAAILSLLGAAGTANAAVTVTFAEGSGVLSPGETVFATFSPGSTGGVTGGGFVVKTGSDGQGADPAVGDQGDPYLSVLAGGTANFLFAGGLSMLGLDYGSADAYNTFTLALSDGTTQIFTGQQLIDSPPANGDQGAARTNGRLTFNAGTGPSIVGLTLQSSQNSLEVDNFGVVGAVPEPGTWAMMLVGFGAMGVAMRRRRRNFAQTVMQIA